MAPYTVVLIALFKTFALSCANKYLWPLLHYLFSITDNPTKRNLHTWLLAAHVKDKVI